MGITAIKSTAFFYMGRNQVLSQIKTLNCLLLIETEMLMKSLGFIVYSDILRYPHFLFIIDLIQN